MLFKLLSADHPSALRVHSCVCALGNTAPRRGGVNDRPGRSGGGGQPWSTKAPARQSSRATRMPAGFPLARMGRTGGAGRPRPAA